MKWFQNCSIKRKLSLLLTLAAGAAVMLAGVAFMAVDIVSFRHETAEHVSAIVDVVGSNSVPALTFNDPETATDVLSSLRFEPIVRRAYLYDTNGQPFATYRRDDLSASSPPPLQTDGLGFTSRGTLDVFKTLSDGNDVVGTLYVQVGTDRLRWHLLNSLAATASVILVTLGVSLIFSTRLQRAVSKPIVQLAETADRISQEGNYAVRVNKTSNDEIGSLFDSFNHMLDRIERSEAELVKAHEELEARVHQRTEELTRANEELSHEIAERKQAESELHKLSRAVQHSPASVVITDTNGTIEYVNPKFTHLTGYTAEEAIGQNPRILKSGQTSLGTYQELWERITSAREWHGELQNRKKDGELYWESMSISPIANSEGAITHFVAIAEDITARKKSEMEVVTLNRKLVETSRAVGKAEVATSVLHNVGNVLNSVNVSSELIRDKLNHSGVADLLHVADILHQHFDELGTYLTEDARGKHLAPFLIDLSRQISDDEQTIRDEIQLLADNVQHIKNIVALQQSNTHAGGLSQEVSLTELAEDALQINLASIERHGIQVIREFEELPVVTLDKQKLLQVLVNLISNAKYALIHSHSDAKRLVVRLRRLAEDRIQIDVEDNGVGIAPENLTRIFAYGFTTRKEGHGFGLHSASLAVRELGGSIAAHSDGLDTGARFSVELPVTIADETHQSVNAE